jgi:hypothetical protein|tara:strand:+ start:1892 stop:2140 length:249 start_codon:yes stop_codon:yes gene_type:complete
MQRVTELLIKKNNSYGNSATEPANIFSKGDAVESICARIDDKIMRIANKGINKNTFDTIDDLIGYLVLLRIAWYDKEINEDK